MTVLKRLPAGISVYAGDFGPFPAAQPLVFAHLWDVAPELDLDHVDVVDAATSSARLAAYFDTGEAERIEQAAAGSDTIVLVLPAAWAGRDAPRLCGTRLRSLGVRRGHVRRFVQRSTRS